jgi:nitroimidazol reductase NimA-like FMN-containing flavoprotein (pyridoxamine 5'-phosphate oxidase superfamily)
VRVRRGVRKGHYDWATIESILDGALVAHISFVAGDEPCCIPMLCARVGRKLYIHGSRGSRAMRHLGLGAPACVTATLVDGLVLARSAFEHTTNYRSVVAFGRFRPIEGDAERRAALEAFTEQLLPGRWSEIRPPHPKELKATAVLAMELDEVSAKVRTGPPDDESTPDAELRVWAGEIPIVTAFGPPVPSPGLRPNIPLASSVQRLLGRG